MNHLILILTLLSTLGCGLIGGVFFAFSTFVMPALARLPPAQGVSAMQSINITVITPSFLLAFVGTAVTCALLAVLSLPRWHDPGAPARFAAALLYLIGTIGVTRVFNIPRNDALARLAPDSAEAAALWPRYLAEWTAWNHVRTVAPLLAMALLLISLVQARR
jgi:uncharacterized membrane protein